MIRGFLGQLGVSHKPEYRQAVADRYGNDALLRHALAVVSWLRAVAGHQAAAKEIYEDGPLLARGFGPSPHIQIEAILTHPRTTEPHVSVNGALHAVLAKLSSAADARPTLHRL